MGDELDTVMPGRLSAPKVETPQPAHTPAAAPFSTGSRYLDEGAVCERDDRAGRGCFLERGQRERIIDRLDSNIGLINGNYQTALMAARIELLMHKKAGWGPVGDILFDLALSAMTAGIGFAVSKIAQSGIKAFLASEAIGVQVGTALGGGATDEFVDKFVAADAKIAKEVVKNVGKLVKPTIKGHFDSFPADVAAKGDFVNTLLTTSSQLFGGVRNNAQENADDVALIALLGAYSEKQMTVDFFRTTINDLLKRFDQHHIADIGPRQFAGVTAGTTETVLIAAHGFSRLAVVNFGERKVLGRSQGETWYTDSGDDFVTFVSDDLADLATQTQRGSVGAVKVIDVHQGHQFRNSQILDAWITQVKIARNAQKART